MNKFFTTMIALVAIALAVPASAQDCQGVTDYEGQEVTFGGYYVDNDACFPEDCLFSIWVYEESNDIPGLQRGDEVVDHTCKGAAFDSDTIII